MELITISFPNQSQMAYFIIDCGLSDFEPDWNNSSLSGYIGDSHLKKAFEIRCSGIAKRKKQLLRMNAFIKTTRPLK